MRLVINVTILTAICALSASASTGEENGIGGGLNKIEKVQTLQASLQEVLAFEGRERSGRRLSEPPDEDNDEDKATDGLAAHLEDELEEIEQFEADVHDLEGDLLSEESSGSSISMPSASDSGSASSADLEEDVTASETDSAAAGEATFPTESFTTAAIEGATPDPTDSATTDSTISPTVGSTTPAESAGTGGTTSNPADLTESEEGDESPLMDGLTNVELEKVMEIVSDLQEALTTMRSEAWDKLQDLMESSNKNKLRRLQEDNGAPENVDTEKDVQKALKKANGSLKAAVQATKKALKGVNVYDKAIAKGMNTKAKIKKAISAAKKLGKMEDKVIKSVELLQQAIQGNGGDRRILVENLEKKGKETKGLKKANREANRNKAKKEADKIHKVKDKWNKIEEELDDIEQDLILPSREEIKTLEQALTDAYLSLTGLSAMVDLALEPEDDDDEEETISGSGQTEDSAEDNIRRRRLGSSAKLK